MQILHYLAQGETNKEIAYRPAIASGQSAAAAGAIVSITDWPAGL
jgi:hypothetical protein